jgi:hypothetical protein
MTRFEHLGQRAARTGQRMDDEKGVPFVLLEARSQTQSQDKWHPLFLRTTLFLLSDYSDYSGQDANDGGRS